MSNNLYLTKMTWEIANRYFQDFVYDPAIFLSGQPVKTFRYSDKWVYDYLEKNAMNEHLAIMLDSNPIGEILFKRMDLQNRTAVFSIHMQNDFVKGKGFGSQATRLAIAYAFYHLKLATVYADAIKENKRSIRVLEKNGFQLLGSDCDFVYYEICNFD